MLADHMVTEEIPMAWWEYALVGVIGVAALVSIIVIVDIIVHMMDQ